MGTAAWESCADPGRGSKGRARTPLPRVGKNTQCLRGPWMKNGFGFSQEEERNFPVISRYLEAAGEATGVHPVVVHRVSNVN